jgi:hypothetical protein
MRPLSGANIALVTSAVWPWRVARGFEPCFTKATGPRKDRFGLWLDERDPNCAPDPFESEAKYPGVKIGARGRSDKFPVGSYYGYATGVVGLRLFPNPAFDEDGGEKVGCGEVLCGSRILQR